MSETTLVEKLPQARRLSMSEAEPSTRGLSRLQKQIMECVREHGYITTFDSTEFAYHGAMASAYASVSRALRRLVERGLLQKIHARSVGYSDVFVSPDNTDEAPLIKRRRNSAVRAA